MKTTILIMSLMLLSFFSQAQKHLVGAYGGLNSFNQSSSLAFNETERGISPFFGLSYQYMIKEKFSLGIDAIYETRKFYSPIILFLWNEPYDITYRLNYLSVPLKAGYNFGNKFYGFVNIGAVPSFLLSGTVTRPDLINSTGVISELVQDLTPSTNRLDISGLAELGGGLKFNSIWVYTSFAYQHGLMNINNAEDQNSPEITLNGVLLSLGMRYMIP